MKNLKISSDKGMFFMYIVAFALFLYVIIFTSGCGARKSSVDISKTKAVQDTNEEYRGETTVDINKSSTTAEIKSDTRNSEAVSTTVKEEFDKETGKLVKKTTRTENKKKSGTSNSSKNKSEQEQLHSHTVKNIVITAHVTETTFNKKKDTDKDNTLVANVGGIWGLLGIVFVISFVIALYKFLTKKWNMV